MSLFTVVSILKLEAIERHRLERMMHALDRAATALEAILAHLVAPLDPEAQAAIDEAAQRLKTANDALSAEVNK